MRVRMKLAISGTRNDRPWPPVGGVIDLPEGEAVDLCRADLAEPAKAAPRERATRAAPERAEATEGTDAGA